MSEYRSPHNDGHDPYILIWEYGTEVQKEEFSERWVTVDENGQIIWHFRLDDGRVMIFRDINWDQKDDVNHLTTVWMRPKKNDEGNRHDS